MSKDGNTNRSRSPRGSLDDEGESMETKLMVLWNKQIEPLMAAQNEVRDKVLAEQNEARDTAVKSLVCGLVSSEVKRLEEKMDSGFVDVHAKVDSGFVGVDKRFGTVNEALARIEQAITAYPAPAPMPSGGSLGPGASGATSAPLAAPSYAGILASPPQHPVVENDVTTPAFTRKTNPTKLFSNMHGKEKVSKRNFTKSIVNLALEANLSEADICVSGNSLDDRFEIQFSGDTRIAAVKCLQFYESLQLGRGKWKPQLATNDTGTDIQFYIAPDKNPCQMRKEILCKHLKGILEGLAIDTTFFVKKATGSIYADKRVVVSVVITGPESARLNWCQAKRIDLGIDQGAAELAFSSHVVSGGPGS